MFRLENRIVEVSFAGETSIPDQGRSLPRLDISLHAIRAPTHTDRLDHRCANQLLLIPQRDAITNFEAAVISNRAIPPITDIRYIRVAVVSAVLAVLASDEKQPRDRDTLRPRRPCTGHRSSFPSRDRLPSPKPLAAITQRRGSPSLEWCHDEATSDVCSQVPRCSWLSDHRRRVIDVGQDLAGTVVSLHLVTVSGASPASLARSTSRRRRSRRHRR